ncbi:MAG: S41 family peptidase [Bdellovibrionales bacterium]|nr:S41 family peptidase [Bdellovibrionales bacterium]
MKKQVLILLASLLLIVAQSGAQASEGKPTSPTQQERYEERDMFQKVIHQVETMYVDEVKHKDLIYGAIKGMLETLDPHSNFLPPNVYREMKEETQGKFGGLGIEIGVKDGVLTVIAPIEDTPAWRAGVKAGDRIVKIGKDSTKGLSMEEAVSKMRGKKGSEVSISIYREGFKEPKEMKLKRDLIKVVSVKNEILEPNYGYVRLTNFNESAAQDIKAAIAKMESKGTLKGLVFDLRNNPGGLLDQAVEVSSLFVDEGVIVSTIGRNRDQKEVKYAKRGKARKDFPVAVLVNASSASAAEIVAGALQDHHRAIVMGQPTFGKGSVQTVMELTPEVGLKLTIARYYTPSGRSIQEKGVKPDVLLEDLDPKVLADARKKTEALREKDLRGHMVNTDVKPEDDKADNEFKVQELELLGKKEKAAKDAKSIADDDEFGPSKINPRDDYQVQAALSQLKSYDVFKKMVAAEILPPGGLATPGTKKASSK